MTAPLHNPPRSSAIPASQNTAPVAEFRCLFTRDIRRKQKRWQDGYLKLHSFNSRVMVYDTSRNYLGDTYWKESHELGEGEELALDNGVLVEVADAVGVTQTDLTPILEKHKKSPQPTPAAGARTLPKPQPLASLASSNLAAVSQRRHKSLSQLLKTPRGPIGKAVPIRSPYEARVEAEKELEKENEWARDRAPKRQKIAPGQAHVGSSSPARGTTSAVGRPASRPAQAPEPRRAPAPSKATWTAPTVVAIDSTPDALLADVFASSPPKLPDPLPKPARATKPKARAQVPAEPSEKATPKVTRNPATRKEKVETPRPPPRSSSPPVSASNRLTNVDFALQLEKEAIKDRILSSSPTEDPNVKFLRLSTGTRRKKLMCESISPMKPKVKKTKKPERRREEVGTEHLDPAMNDPIPINDDRMSIQQAPQKSKKPSTRAKRKSPQPGARDDAAAKRRKANEPSAESFDFDTPGLGDIDFIHGMMDQQMLPRESGSPDHVSRHDVLAATTHQRPNNPKPLPNQNPPKEKPPRTNTRQDAPSKCQKRPGTPDGLVQMSITIPDSPSPERSLPSSPSLDFPAPVEHTTTITEPEPEPEPEPVPKPTRKSNPPERQPLPPVTNKAQLIRRIKSASYVEDMDLDEGPDPPIPSITAEWERRNLSSDIHSKENTDPKTTTSTTTTTTTAASVKTSNPASGTGSGLAALIKKTDPRRTGARPLSRTLSLDTAQQIAGGKGKEVEIPSPVADEDVGPWSTEAFDLFGWRPPGR